MARNLRAAKSSWSMKNLPSLIYITSLKSFSTISWYNNLKLSKLSSTTLCSSSLSSICNLESIQQKDHVSESLLNNDIECVYMWRDKNTYSSNGESLQYFDTVDSHLIHLVSSKPHMQAIWMIYVKQWVNHNGCKATYSTCKVLILHLDNFIKVWSFLKNSMRSLHEWACQKSLPVLKISFHVCYFYYTISYLNRITIYLRIIFQ